MSGIDGKFFDSLKRNPAIAGFSEAIKNGDDRIVIQGARGSLRGILASFAHLERGLGPTLVLAPDTDAAQEIFRDAAFVFDLLKRNRDEEVFLFEDLNLVAQDFLTLSELEIIFYRYRILEKLVVNSPVLVVTSRAALGVPLVAPSRYRQHMISIKPGDSLDKNQFLKSLFSIGYRLVGRVREIGQVAGRGGIIDAYPPGRKRPVRIDLFGDKVESLREFDPESQRSLGEVDNLLLSPCFEAELLRDQDPEALFDYEGELKDPSYLQDEPIKFREFSPEEKNDFLSRGFSYFDKSGIWDYLPESAQVIVDSPGLALGRNIATELPKSMGSDGVKLPEFDGLVHGGDDIATGLSIFPRIEFLSPTCPLPFGIPVPDLHASPIGHMPGSFDRRLEQYVSKFGVKRDEESDKPELFIVSRSSERIGEIIGDYDHAIDVLHGDLTEGFDLWPHGPTVITDSELFPARQRGFARVRGKTKAFTREELREVRIGDYLVHVNFGVGVFKGIVQQKGHEGSIRDYILIEYAQNDKLYVPVEQIDQLFRYTSSEGVAPTIHRLGSSDWNRLKRKVKKTLVRMAEDLLKLYRSRMEVKGHSFQPDTVWQKEIEDKFEFQETPGQLRSLDELKSDMEQEKPMDRLICAEVGYGKTELAVRAALKAVLDGMQAAVLVPTTILAQQHYLTFVNRLKDLPIKIALISRFKSRKEQKESLKLLQEGGVDILIGTHRILSKDVVFRNLGLLIVDEEQKFGVRHKEKIRFLKNTIDVLTLTATPIPRTLYMSLIGLKDISVIDTPPPDRLPIRTYVKHWNPYLVKKALQAEVARGGQVYYLHNRVESIDSVARKLKALIPEARIAVAHGQMDETGLEKVMMEFMSGEHDILVCTTIIENGLDIPNVNTLIVEDAQNFGLAQLHQVRGRVGRSDLQAYAYFLFPPAKILSGLAVKRLEALASFSHLGAGYEIALRDLELRGAGNILGPEQHGFVMQLGFDLYTKVLSETIDQVRDGEADFDRIGSFGRRECVFRIPIDARIPSSYLLDQTERFALYRKLGTVGTQQELEAIKEEMADRFGVLPPEVENLIEILKLRLKAMDCGVEAISYLKAEKVIEVRFDYSMLHDERWPRIGNMVMRAKLKPQPRGFLVAAADSPEKVMVQVRHIIGELKKACGPIARPVDAAV